MKPQTVREMWSGFEEQVVPENAGTMQRTWMKMAFFAGAGAILASMKFMVDRMPDADAVEAVGGWLDECNVILNFTAETFSPISDPNAIMQCGARREDCALARGYAWCDVCQRSSYAENH